MILRWLDKTTLPVEMDHLTPETFLGLSAAEAAGLSLNVGNQRAEVGDLFSVSTDDREVFTLEGDLRAVRGIGRGMARGTLEVRGEAGSHVGVGMTGGVLTVHGDVEDWAGAGMRGGLLRVQGNAGHFVGAAEPGGRIGMRDGVILVHGSVGDEAGRKMRRGLIAVGGDAGDWFGRALIAGSLFAFGSLGRHAGSGMKRGTIAALGPGPVEVPPSFVASGRFRFPFLTVYLRGLAGWGFPVPGEVFLGAMGRYNGDLADGGRGELLVRGGSIER